MWFYCHRHFTDVDCEALNEIENGKMVLVDGRTTYNATAGYSCAENYTLVGESKQVCGDKGIWMPEQPKCLCKDFSLVHLLVYRYIIYRLDYIIEISEVSSI